MEDSKHSHLSDRDRNMSESFESFGDGDDKKSKKKKPKRSLFLPADMQDTKPPEKSAKVIDLAESRAQRTEGLLRGLLSEATRTNTESSEIKNDPHSSERVDESKKSDPQKVILQFSRSELTATIGETDNDTPKTTEDVNQGFEDVLAEKIDEVSDELSSAEDDLSKSAIKADQELLVKIKEHVSDGEAPVAAIETALTEVFEADSVNEDFGDVPLNTLSFQDQLSESEPESEDENTQHSTPTAPSTQSQTKKPQTTTAGAYSQTHASHQASQRNNGPPQPPAIPPILNNYNHLNYGGPNNPGGSGPNSIIRPSGPNIIAAATANIDPNLAKMNEYYYRRKNTGKIILAGLVGYAVGRRGGRKRAESKLQPEIDAGKKHIKGLEQKLEQSEQTVRKKVVENQELSSVLQAERSDNVDRKKPVVTETSPDLNAKTRSKEPTKAEAINTPVPSASETVTRPVVTAETIAEEVREIQRQREEFFENLVAEASSVVSPAAVVEKASGNQPAVSEKSYENVGLQTGGDKKAIKSEFSAEVLNDVPATLSAESSTDTFASTSEIGGRREHASEQRKKSAEVPIQRTAEKFADVRSLSMPELLSVAEKIDVGSGSLKDMYEQSRIDAVNLRKVVAEYAAGHNYSELLTRSLEAEEMKHELRNEIKTASTMAASDSRSTARSGGSGVVGSGAPATMANATHSTKIAQAPALPPNILQQGILQDMSIRQHSTPTAQIPQTQTEYIRVSTPLAIGIGLVTGGIITGLLLLLIF